MKGLLKQRFTVTFLICLITLQCCRVTDFVNDCESITQVKMGFYQLIDGYATCLALLNLTIAVLITSRL